MNDIADISDVAKLVGRLIPGTEEQFLLIGSGLNKVYTDVENVSRQASALVGLLDSSAMKGMIVRFRDVLGQLERYIDKFHQRFESGHSALKDVGNAVTDVAIPMANFRKIVKKLKILGISTKIESAQLKKMEIDFVNLAGDVEELSELIHDKSAEIEKHRASLMGLTSGTLSKIFTISQKSKNFTDAALADINSSIAILEGRTELSFTTADSILSRSHATSARVGEVVMSMQFHDITRQQIEHIVDVLETLDKKYSDKAHPDDGTSQPGGGMLAEAIVVCELQKAQLIDAKDKFIKAVCVIMDNLHGISVNVGRIIDDVQKMTGATDFSSDNFLSNIETGTAAVMDKINHGTKAEEEFIDAMGELTMAVSTISGLVDDIEEIGEEIELIAVNARVKAARTGEEGAPLGVIAEAIWHLSLDATSQKSVISDLLKKVVLATEGLQSATMQADTFSGDHDTIAELSRIVVGLKRMKDDIIELVKEIASGSRSLSGLIEETIDDITVHDNLERDTANVCAIFDEFISQARQKVSPAEIEDARRQSFEFIQNNYTMQRERAIHHNIASNVIPIDNKNREAAEGFMACDDEPDELGDNVELF